MHTTLLIIIQAIWQAIWPPARRRRAEQKAWREAKKRTIEGRDEQRQKNAEKQRQRSEQQRQECERHKSVYRLNRIGTRKIEGIGGPNGEPISIADLAKAVHDRLRLVAAVGCEAGIERATAEEVAALTSHLDPRTLRGLLDHEDPIRQRDAAETIREARLKLNPEPEVSRYATAVAEAAAMQRRPEDQAGVPETPDQVADMVCARAILWRAMDYHWDKIDRGVRRPLSGLPPRPR